MATYVLIHGSGSDSWYWHRVAPELSGRGHDVVAPDLPTGDDSAGLLEYADAVVAATGERRDVVLVAQSLAGFVAPLVCEHVPVRLMVLVTAMVPRPGESPGEWFANTGWAEARRAQAEREGREVGDDVDVVTEFFHDVPEDVVDEAFIRPEPVQAETPFGQPWPLDAWPDVPTRFVLCRRDRFFPADFMRHVVHERLGIEPDELASGHLPALSQPAELVRLLERFRASVSA
jgi:pimeloyl-ACP methyl ester carboxylesterase